MLQGAPPASVLENNSKIWRKYRADVDFFTVQEISLHQLKTRFANLEEDLCLAGPTSGTMPRCTPLSTTCSVAQGKMQRADGIACMYSAIIFHPKLTQISGYVCYVVLFLQSKFLSKPCIPKLRVSSIAFRVSSFVYRLLTIEF